MDLWGVTLVYRIFVEKKPGLDNEARALLGDAKKFLGIKGLEKVRLLNRYDAENISDDMFSLAVREVFSEPQLDNTMDQFDAEGAIAVFAVEYLPGQFDQRADSAAQCIQILSKGERPTVRTAKVYVLSGELTAEELETVKHYVINPVEAREASLEKPETLKTDFTVLSGHVHAIITFIGHLPVGRIIDREDLVLVGFKVGSRRNEVHHQGHQ